MRCSVHPGLLRCPTAILCAAFPLFTLSRRYFVYTAPLLCSSSVVHSLPWRRLLLSTAILFVPLPALSCFLPSFFLAASFSPRPPLRASSSSGLPAQVRCCRILFVRFQFVYIVSSVWYMSSRWPTFDSFPSSDSSLMSTLPSRSLPPPPPLLLPSLPLRGYPFVNFVPLTLTPTQWCYKMLVAPAGPYLPLSPFAPRSLCPPDVRHRQPPPLPSPLLLSRLSHHPEVSWYRPVSPRLPRCRSLLLSFLLGVRAPLGGEGEPIITFDRFFRSCPRWRAETTFLVCLRARTFVIKKAVRCDNANPMTGDVCSTVVQSRRI